MNPIGPRPEQIYLEAMRISVSERLGDFALSRMRYELHREFDPLGIAHRLSTEILRYSTEPTIHRDRTTATAAVVRFATWWDHFKAVYRRRWWMRWYRWEIHYWWAEETAVAEVTVRATREALFPHAGGMPDWLGPPYPVIRGERVRYSDSAR
jgi:hypothetical protein